jgi:hypothetical protein
MVDVAQDDVKNVILTKIKFDFFSCTEYTRTTFYLIICFSGVTIIRTPAAIYKIK